MVGSFSKTQRTFIQKITGEAEAVGIDILDT